MDTDEMSFTVQSCKELNTFDIFRPDIIDMVKDLYYPIFEKIRIYGTIEDPVFVAKDVQDALGLKDMNYSRDGLWIWDREKIKIKIQTSGGAQQVIALTEQGLYKSIFHSNVEMALKFQTFITCVMKRLRITGIVNMEQALEDYKRENARLEGRLKAFDMQMEMEHKELMHYKHEHDHLVLRHQDDNLALWKAKQKIENARDPDVDALKERLERLMRRSGRAVHIMLCDPPKEYQEDYEYQTDMYSEGDYDVIDPTDPMIWSIGLTVLKTKVSIKTAYVHKTVKLDQIYNALKSYRLVHKKDEIYYQNMYEISLDQIDQVIDQVNRADEQNCD